MKQVIYIFLIFSTLVGCQSNESDKTENEKLDEIKIERVDSVEQVTEKIGVINKKNDRTIIIKDSSDYSINFLNSMVESGMDNVSLIDSFLILGQKDTVVFPQIPKIGKKTILTAKKDELAIALRIERVNQTTIDYNIEMVEFGKVSYNFKGQADLSPHFYFGAEVDENELTGNAYLSTEFWDNNDTCYTALRIGIDEKYLLGKIKKNCNEKIGNIGLNNFPTLIEK